MNVVTDKTGDPVVMPLSNGLRMLYIPSPHCAVEYFGVVVDAGSRDDPDGLYGLAHFVEHTLFKGTDRRKSWHIINRMEACGGELNAYTTKESTTVYSVFPAGNLARAAELIGDLVAHSRFPSRELEKERDVVGDEISSYLDIPSEAVYDDFEDLLFRGSSLGHNILGNETALSRFDSASCRSFVDSFYTTDRMLVFYCGASAQTRAAGIAERCFADVSPAGVAVSRTSPARRPAFDNVRDLSIHQSHTIVGARVCDMFSPARLPLSVLVNMLGGPGMNSLLNVELREKRGLVYSVDASLSLLTDCGIFAVYFGCDHSDTSKCHKIIDSVVSRLAETRISERKLTAVIRQHIGQMTVATDNRENTVLSMAKSALYRNRIDPLGSVVEKLRALTPEDIRGAAEAIVRGGLSTLTFC